MIGSSIITRKNDLVLDTISGSKDNVYIYFSETFSITISYLLPWEDYLIELPRNVGILDRNWNEWVMHVSEEFEIEVGFEGQVNMFHKIIEEYNFYIEDDLKPLITGSLHN